MNVDRVHPDCREFVNVIEELLKRRQQEVDQRWAQDDWGPRTWTRTELEDMVYSSYKRMRQGDVTRPPRRSVVMDIADYLNCTLEERNRLLMAAHTAPISPYFTGQRLEKLLQVTIEAAQHLDVPVIVINRDWHIHYMNEQALALNAITMEEVAAIPPHYLNFLRLMFDPELPLYPNLARNRVTWTRMARQTIYGFKMANVLCQFEDWYQNLVQEFMSLPEFAAHWNSVNIDLPFEHDQSARNLPEAVTVELTTTRQQLWMRPLVISAGYFQFDFPQILAFLPADSAALP